MSRDRDDEVLVLCYHAVSREWENALAVTPEELGAYVGAMLDEGFEPVTFREAVDPARAGMKLAVTFDDAYLSVVELALPVLRGLDVPGTVFVPTGYIGAPETRGWEGTRALLDTESAAELEHASWRQLGELSSLGWEIGAHTRTHPHLPALDDAALAAELLESRRDVGRELAIDCRSLAYPYGEADARVRAAAAAAGYEAGGALSYRLPRGPLDPLLWPRLTLHRGDTPTDVKSRLYRRSPLLWNAFQGARDAVRRARGRA